MGLSEWFVQKQVRSYTRGVCNTMIVCSNAILNASKDKKIAVKTFSELAAMTLAQRPKWKENSPNIFSYKNLHLLEIGNDFSVSDMTLGVILIELKDTFGTIHLPQNVKDVAVKEFANIFTTYPDDKLQRNVELWS